MLFSLIALACAGQAHEISERDSFALQMLHRSDEVYVVRYIDVVKSEYLGADKLSITAEIEQIIKGTQGIGYTIKFERLYDFDYGDVTELIDKRFLVFLEEVEGKSEVNRQDPAAVQAFSQNAYDELMLHQSH
ncbi:hypothetical protein [Bowmanella sp. JS7-9]|uniref:Uncharacterized protein n=1 Tax=Pseudobowmanella zhangzhouensis TaxID=1537679 RepID=A0ABW1XN87_9ALTE|nr:hypothetical protein [Bowmanella sp. JS7-9]